VGDEAILAQCGRVVMARLETPLWAANVFVEPSLKTSREGLYIARTLARALPRVRVRIINVTNQDQILGEGTTIGHGEPVTWAASVDDQEQQPRRMRWLCKELGARPNLYTKEANVLEEFIAEFQDVFATKSGDYGRTDKVYHQIDTGDAHPIRQHPRILSLAMQADVNGMLEDMKKRGVIEESDSPWSSPVMLIRKKNGDFRLCVDYRRLKDVTKRTASRFQGSTIPWIR
jgi:hypothetical protein